jgi:hypothetical protein
LALGLDGASLLMRSRRPPDLKAAEDYCHEAFALRQRLTKLLDTASQHQALTATCLRLGELLRVSCQHAEAVPVYREAQRSLNALGTRFPNTRGYREQQVQCHSGLGHAFMRTGKAPEAMAAYREALAAYDRLRLGDLPAARRSYNEGVRQLQGQEPVEPTLARVRAEVESLLGIGPPSAVKPAAAPVKSDR